MLNTMQKTTLLYLAYIKQSFFSTNSLWKSQQPIHNFISGIGTCKLGTAEKDRWMQMEILERLFDAKSPHSFPDFPDYPDFPDFLQ